MKLSLLLLGVSMSVTLTTTVAINKSSAQLLDVKPWHGYYPEMGNSYPLSFIAFKGWLFPVPHVFIRTWPTHYYVEAGALPVSDSEGYTNRLRIQLMKMASRLIEKRQMEDRHEHTIGIREDTQVQYKIERIIFDAESDQLSDVYGITSGFIRLYKSIDRLDQLEDCGWLKQLLVKEADQLLTRFVSVNLFQAEHGQKLKAFGEIKTELNRQIGAVDYTYRKVHHSQFYADNVSQPYSFLTQ